MGSFKAGVAIVILVIAVAFLIVIITSTNWINPYNKATDPTNFKYATIAEYIGTGIVISVSIIVIISGLTYHRMRNSFQMMRPRYPRINMYQRYR